MFSGRNSDYVEYKAEGEDEENVEVDDDDDS